LILIAQKMHGNPDMTNTPQTCVTSADSASHWPGRFSVAPMLDWTDRHCRYFLRLLSRHTLLYTEMVTTGAIIHGKGDYLAYSDEEHPVALQLGGSDTAQLAHCAKLAEARGYDEINLNVGCPSDRVQNGRFGACLMGEAQLVADCIKAMRDVVSIPVTVKTRIGIDEQDSYEFLCDFIGPVAGKGECEIERELSQGAYLGHITRHMLGLFQGVPGARQWRRYLSENAHKAGADINVVEHALNLVASKR